MEESSSHRPCALQYQGTFKPSSDMVRSDRTDQAGIAAGMHSAHVVCKKAPASRRGDTVTSVP